MALDGFSMGNLGLPNELTSAQMANQAEQLANRDAEIKVKDVSEMAKEHGIKRKEENSENREFKDGFNKKKDEENENEEDETSEESENSSSEYKLSGRIDEKDLENNPKAFSVRINQETEMVELFSNKNNQILETISAKDLMGLISKLDSASGILVNRKI